MWCGLSFTIHIERHKNQNKSILTQEVFVSEPLR